MRFRGAIDLGPGRHEVTAYRVERAIPEREFVAAAVLVGQNLVEDRPENVQLTCYKTGESSRLIYRPCPDARPDGRKSFSWKDYRDLI